MSRSGRLKEKYERTNRLSVDKYDEGSSARTRPFSLEEIMHRRKNKLSENVKEPAKEAYNISPGDSSKNISDHFDSGRVHGRIKSLAYVVEKHIPEETVKVSSRTKVENTYIKDDNSIKAKDRENHYSESGGLNNMGRIGKGSKGDKEASSRRKNDGRLSDSSEYKVEDKHSRGSRYEETNREKYEKKRWKKYENGDDENLGEYNTERKHDKDRHGAGKRKKWTSDDTERGAEKKHQLDPAGKGRQPDSRGKYEREIRRKYQNDDDDYTQNRSVARKKDPENHRDPGTFDRKERRETAKSRHDESREERRRSRSREHGSRRRSPSLSPRKPKHNYYDEEHKELSIHSLKESSQKQTSDVDRRRISTNGSSSHHHRHGASTSGLGGYSPRKRKSEAAVKTPSPSKNSVEKKRVGWDLPPEGADDSSLALVSSSCQLVSPSVLSSIHDLATAKSVDLAIVKPLSVSTLNDSIKNANIDYVQLTQATRPKRRLYLENLPASASEKAVMDSLNSLLLSAGLSHVQGAQPCISCILHQERGQALVEFLTSEDATSALSFDGSKLFGSIVKIRRPKDYIEVATGDIESSMDAAVTTSDVVIDSPDKIFIGGISKELSSEMLMEIVGAFGSLKAYHFQNDDPNGTCAFLEYADHSVTLKACAGLNGMKLAGEVLTVVQAMPCAPSLENGRIAASYGIPDHAKPLLRKPTEILKIKNVFTAEALSSLSDMEIEEVLEDVRLECARFGTIKSINVVKYSSDRNDTTKSGKLGVTKDMQSKGAPQDSERDNSNAESSFSEMTTNHESKGTSKMEVRYDREEMKEDKVDKDSSVDVDKVGGESLASESSQGEEHVSDTTFQDMGNRSIPSSTSQEAEHQNTCKDQSELPDDVVADGVGVHGKNKTVAGDNDSKDADCKFHEGFSEVDEGIGTEPVHIKKGIDEEDDISDHEFELGSVLVEYGRTEACCAAAHCLHGRLFDDRIVTLEYVALNPYRARFKS
ncbi:hypothetical protein L6164_025930 [Bauhinia variegata]|uniref:Uncharacterized protein n=1 Tax=Bauhinia variegata TaxID=167791 RepID=A0ACB9M553_BAUVA|nr:hypothetical protein L6164_025930 [Bauhinia variegata]